MRAFLLAAGFGTRLWPLSDVRAKPAFPYRGKPLIAHVADLVLKHGARAIVVNTHHLPETVRASLSSYDATFIHEPEILGTAGALVNVRHLLEGDEPVVVMNAKVITNIDLTAAVKAHQDSGAPVTMVCVPNLKRENFNHVGAKNGLFSEVVPYQQLSQVPNPRIFTGVQILSKEFWGYLPPPGFSDTIKDVYPKIKNVHVHDCDAEWAEFSTLRRYRDLQGDNVVWDGAKVQGKIEGCIIADGVSVPAGAHWKDVAVIQAERVREHKNARIENGLLFAPV